MTDDRASRTTQLTIELPEALRDELLAWAEDTGHSVSEIVVDAVEALKAEEEADRQTIASRDREPGIPLAEALHRLRTPAGA